jgi:hypothetical protein
MFNSQKNIRARVKGRIFKQGVDERKHRNGTYQGQTVKNRKS